MARRVGKRGGSKMRMSKAAKRRAHVLLQREKAAVKQQRKSRIRDDDYESQAANAEAGGCKGKTINLDQSDADTNGDDFLSTSLQGFSEEKSTGPASWSSDNTPGKGCAKHDQKGKRNRKFRKEIKEISEMSSENQSTTENTPRKSFEKCSKRRRFNHKMEEETNHGNHSAAFKTADPSATVSTSKMGNHLQDVNDVAKGVAQGAEPEEKATAKDVIEEKQE